MTKIQIKDSNWDVIKNVEIDFKKPVLKQLESEDIEIPNACRAWMCAACMCYIEKWWEHAVKNLRWEPAFPLWDDEIMTCIWWFADTKDEIILKTMS